MINLNTQNDPHPLYLWKFESATSTVYLAGSLHAMKADMKAPDLYERAFEKSTCIALECNASCAVVQQKTKQFIQTHAMLGAGQTLQTVLPQKTYYLLAKSFKDLGKDVSPYAKFKPDIAASALGTARNEALGLSAAHGLDKHFTVKASHRRIHNLETVEEQFESLKTDLKEQADRLTGILETWDKNGESIKNLVAAWMNGNDVELEKYSLGSIKEADKKKFHETLTKRNKTMSEKIEGLLGQHGTCFALIGCMHTVGQNSVVELLQKKGYKCTRYSSTDKL